MCGYSTTSYPLDDATPAPADTSAPTAYSPGLTPAGGDTVNFTVASSFSRSKATGADAGGTRQPSGACTDAVAVTGPFWLLLMVTSTVRVCTTGRAPAAGTIRRGAAPAGTTVMSGDTRTSNGGATCSSIRFSPANRSL